MRFVWAACAFISRWRCLTSPNCRLGSAAQAHVAFPPSLPPSLTPFLPSAQGCASTSEKQPQCRCKLPGSLLSGKHPVDTKQNKTKKKLNKPKKKNKTKKKACTCRSEVNRSKRCPACGIRWATLWSISVSSLVHLCAYRDRAACGKTLCRN